MPPAKHINTVNYFPQPWLAFQTMWRKINRKRIQKCDACAQDSIHPHSTSERGVYAHMY